MRYCFDNDLHIHSCLSLCSGDSLQTPDTILKYALDNGLKTICLTDHYWDETVPGASDWYAVQNYGHIAQSLPLPQTDGVRFLFGCETELREDMTLGISPVRYDSFDFIIIPTTHLHMNGFTCRGDEVAAERARLWIKRFDSVLDMPLPFHKVGIAHLTCELMYPGHYLETLGCLTEDDYAPLFHKAAERGAGIELNFPVSTLNDENRELILRPYRVAKEQGCKFYFGSDAHHPQELEAEKQNAETIIDLLALEEKDKFCLT
ncbi:MAG: PHP domain-containing protein [Clostridia bacterium]|nr:PHP domain-containing protein [Clostridia bacterium]